MRHVIPLQFSSIVGILGSHIGIWFPISAPENQPSQISPMTGSLHGFQTPVLTATGISPGLTRLFGLTGFH